MQTRTKGPTKLFKHAAIVVVLAVAAGIEVYVTSPASAETRESVACRVLNCDFLSPEIGRHLVIQELNDAVDVVIQRMGDSCSDYDDCYAKRGMAIGSIYWRGGHRGREGDEKFWYGNGADGRVAGISARAQEDFGRDNGAGSLEFCTAMRGQENADCGTRLVIEPDGCITITERGAVRVDASTNYVQLCSENGKLVVRQRDGTTTTIGATGAEAKKDKDDPPTTARAPAKTSCTHRAGSGFTDGWYTPDGKLVEAGDKSSRPSACGAVDHSKRAP
jgi:hypothetical protein